MVRGRAPKLCVVIPLITVVGGCSLLTDLHGLDEGRESVVDAQASADVAAPMTIDGSTEGTSDGDVVDGSDSGSYTFLDDFARADTTSGLGNGWVDKSPAFRIASGEAVRLANTSGSYTDLVTTRPANEAILDVEISVEVRFVPGPTWPGYAQLAARVQTSTLHTAGAMDAYLIYRNQDDGPDGKTFTIKRDRTVGGGAALASFRAEGLVADPGKTFRLRLRVRGASPVELAGSVEQETTSGWTELGSTVVQDASTLRIDTAGVVGLGAAGAPPRQLRV